MEPPPLPSTRSKRKQKESLKSESATKRTKNPNKPAPKALPRLQPMMPTPRQMFLPIKMYLSPAETIITNKTADQEVNTTEPTVEPGGAASEDTFKLAMDRLKKPDVELHLALEQRVAIRALLSVLNSHLRPSPSKHHDFVGVIASPDTTIDELKEISGRILTGLRIFAARGGRGGKEEKPHPPPIDPSMPSSGRSLKVKMDCNTRDGDHCQITHVQSSPTHPLNVCHILAFSIKDGKSFDFWKFIAMFLGDKETEQLREMTLAPSTMSTDCIQNVMLLESHVHHYFDTGSLSLVPNIEDLTFPYDMATTTQYSATVEMANGSQQVAIAVFKWVKVPGEADVRKLDYELKPGDQVTFTTTDPKTMPIPHPLLLQLHALVCRILHIQGAAGYPVLPDYDDSDSEISVYAESLCFSEDEASQTRPEWIGGDYVDWSKHPISETLRRDFPKTDIDYTLEEQGKKQATQGIKRDRAEYDSSNATSVDEDQPPRKVLASVVGPFLADQDSSNSSPDEAASDEMQKYPRSLHSHSYYTSKYDQEVSRDISAVMSEAFDRVIEKNRLYHRAMRIRAFQGDSSDSE